MEVVKLHSDVGSRHPNSLIKDHLFSWCLVVHKAPPNRTLYIHYLIGTK